MTTNWDTHATWAYHDATKHTSISVRSGNHVMDMTNQPRPWKLYSNDLPVLQLNQSVSNSGATALDAIGSRTSNLRSPLTLDDLATVLLLSAGVTKTLPVPGGFMQFRAAACTGALYHIELYVVTKGLEGLAAGVYHYGVHDNSLRMLREGDFRQMIGDATGGNPAASSAEALIVYSTTYWRNAWKYASRAYRHAFWDAGTVIAHTLAVANTRNLASSVLTGFADGDVNGLIGITPDREAAVAIVTLGNDEAPLPFVPPITDLKMIEIPLSRSETFFSAITDMHQASSLTLEDTQGWSLPMRPAKSRRNTTAFELPLPFASSKGIEETIVKRGSSRRFDGSAVSQVTLATILAAALAHIPLDARGLDQEAIVEAFLIINAVDELDPGVYAYDRSTNRLHQLGTGETREVMSHLALDQSLGGNAAFNIYFLADLNTLLPDLGNRAYRAAHLDASIAAGRAYLAAYSLGLGATGLTFYDDEVIAYLGKEAENLSVMFLLAVGNPSPRSSY